MSILASQISKQDSLHFYDVVVWRIFQSIMLGFEIFMLSNEMKLILKFG